MADEDRDQPGDGGGSFANPTMFKTMEEASAHAQKIAEQEAKIKAMTPEERQFYFDMLANANPEDLEQ